MSAADNGASVSLDYVPVNTNFDHEWTTIETVLIRISIGWAPNSSFPVYSKGARGYEVGYDAAVCVQKYEPWIIEAYNAPFAPPSILGIVEKGNSSTSPSGNILGLPIENTRYLNTSNKYRAFDKAHDNGINQMRRTDPEVLPYYLPYPTVGHVVIS